MKKLSVIAFVALMFITIGFIAMQSPSQKTNVDKTPENSIGQEPSDRKDITLSNETYIDYGPLAISQSKGRRVVLFFHATWCPTCKAADKAFRNDINKIPEDVTIIKVNYNDPDTEDAEKNLAVKYGITYQHTFVQIDEAGKEIAKWNGGDIANLVGNIK